MRWTTRTLAACSLLAALAAAPPAIGLNTADLEAFTDDIVHAAMQRSGVPGAIVAVVGRDAPLLVKGYGVADLSTGTQVDPDTTLFGIASISKTMTAILASQLVAEGRIDPHRDVGFYLDGLQVTGGSVTLHQLLGHRAGFDGDLSFLFIPAGADPAMSRDALERRLVLMREPGTVNAYDNLAYGLAGLLASAVTGQSLERLFRQRLFEPAGMNAALGAPGTAANRLARCYVPAGPDHVPACTNVVASEAVQGAGGVMATAAGMARYMRMLLNDGSLDGKTVVPPEALAAALEFDIYRFYPGLPGLGRAFMQFPDLEGHRAYGHGGSIPGFSSDLRIYPDVGLGVLVSFMGGQAPTFDLTLSNLVDYLSAPKPQGEALEGLVTLHRIGDTIAAHVLPEISGQVEPPVDVGDTTAAEVAELAGRWYPTKDRSRNPLAKLMRWSAPLTVAAARDDAITLNGQGPYRRVGPMLFENESGQRVAFRRSPAGTFMATNMSIATFERLGAFEAPAWAPTLVLASCLVLVFTVVYLWPGSRSPLRRPARWALAASVMTLACLALELEHGIRLTVAEGRWALPAAWRIGLHLGLLVLLLSPVAIWRSLRPDTSGPRWRRVGRKIYGTVQALASLAIVAALWAWGFVGTVIGMPPAG